jgi:hypothetical protein
MKKVLIHMYTILFFIISIIFIIFSGISESIMDKIQFHFSKSIFSKFKNQLFWDPSISWRNKYKNGDPKQGSKFWGSTTYFVFVTDAWHFFKFLKNTSMFISMGISMYGATFMGVEFDTSNTLIILMFLIIGRSFFGLSFNLFFDKILNLD